MFNIFSSKFYSSKKNTKLENELIGESLPLNIDEQFSSIPIINNNENLLNKENKHEIKICRICYSTGDLQSLIAPCKCSGTMGILHRNCLEQWLEISNTTKCEICQYEFEVLRYPKSLFYFLKNPLHSSDIRYLINDIILFIILTTVISWLTILSIEKIQTTKTLYDDMSYFILLLSIGFIYIVWCWVSFRYHIQVIREWRSANQLIRLINKKEMEINCDNNLIVTFDNEQHFTCNRS